MTLRVKLEVVPFGDEDWTYEIGRLDIFNKGPVFHTPHGDPDFCSYGVLNLTPRDIGLYDDVVHHQRTDGAWALVREVLRQLQVRGPT